MTGFKYFCKKTWGSHSRYILYHCNSHGRASGWESESGPFQAFGQCESAPVVDLEDWPLAGGSGWCSEHWKTNQFLYVRIHLTWRYNKRKRAQAYRSLNLSKIMIKNKIERRGNEWGFGRKQNLVNSIENLISHEKKNPLSLPKFDKQLNPFLLSN